MKKTLVAIAALAVVGAASAQSTVNLTGKFRFAYQSFNNGTGTATAKSSGFAVTDGDVVFAAVEDLGGGMKAGATMAVRVRGRATTSTASATAVVAPATTLAGSASGAPVDGRDATIWLSGGFGTLVGGAVEAANGIIGFGGAGAPVIGLDNGTSLDGGTNVDWLAYTTPSMGGFTATIQLIDSIGAPGTAGLQSTAATQDATLIGVGYSNGPINFKGDYTSFGVNSVTTALTTAADTRLRLSGNYNLGVATVGIGYQSKENQAGLKDKQWILGAAAPFGPVTVGANYVRHTTSANLKVSSFDLGVQYNLSKRTYVQAAYQTQDSNAAATPNNITQVRLQLAHSF